MSIPSLGLSIIYLELRKMFESRSPITNLQSFIGFVPAIRCHALCFLVSYCIIVMFKDLVFFFCRLLFSYIFFSVPQLQ